MEKNKKKTDLGFFWSFLTQKLTQKQVTIFRNIFIFIFFYLCLFFWIFWHQIFKNPTKIELTVFYSVKYSKYSWFAIMTSKNEGCQLVIFFNFFFSESTCPQLYKNVYISKSQFSSYRAASNPLKCLKLYSCFTLIKNWSLFLSFQAPVNMWNLYSFVNI